MFKVGDKVKVISKTAINYEWDTERVVGYYKKDFYEIEGITRKEFAFNSLRIKDDIVYIILGNYFVERDLVKAVNNSQYELEF